MSVSYSLHFLLAGWSVIAGIALGFLYEFFRLLHRLHQRAVWLIFIDDLLFCMCCTCALSLLFFNLSFGQMRLYAFACLAAGFAVWYFTFGRLFRKALSRLHRLLLPRWEKRKSRFHTKLEGYRYRHRARMGFGIQKHWRKQIRREREHAAQS